MRLGGTGWRGFSRTDIRTGHWQHYQPCGNGKSLGWSLLAQPGSRCPLQRRYWGRSGHRSRRPFNEHTPSPTSRCMTPGSFPAGRSTRRFHACPSSRGSMPPGDHCNRRDRRQHSGVPLPRLRSSTCSRTARCSTTSRIHGRPYRRISSATSTARRRAIRRQAPRCWPSSRAKSGRPGGCGFGPWIDAAMRDAHHDTTARAQSESDLPVVSDPNSRDRDDLELLTAGANNIADSFAHQ